jgi:hypothetical protein
MIAVGGAVLARLIADELKAWSPWITQKLIKAAVSQLAESQRERFSEEWLSHLNEIPGDLTKIGVALGFLLAAGKMNPSVENRVQKIHVKTPARPKNPVLTAMFKVIEEAVLRSARILLATTLGAWLLLLGCTINIIVSLSVPLIVIRDLLTADHNVSEDLRNLYGPGASLVRKGRELLGTKGDIWLSR